MSPRPLTSPQRRALWVRLVIRIGLLTLFVLFSIYALPPLFSLFAPFLCALVVAALLNPAIFRLEQAFGWGRGVFTLLLLALVVALLGGGLFALFSIAIGESLSLVRNWEYLLSHLTDVITKLSALSDKIWSHIPPTLSSSVNTAYGHIIDWLQSTAPTLLESLASHAGRIVTQIPSFLLALLIFLMATYFITADYPNLRTKMAKKLDSPARALLKDLRATALSAFGGYLKAQVLLSIGVFFILLAGFIFIRMDYALLLALFLAILDFIPILGAGTVMVPWSFIALFTDEYRSAIELILIWGFTALFRRLSEPKFVGNQTGLSPILSLVSIYVGMMLGGIVGMIIGPIIALIALNLIESGIFRELTHDISIAIGDIRNFLRNSK